jgi:hypothetical protein
MKKSVIIAILALLTMTSYAQNGGQYAENNSVKIKQLVSTVTGKIVIEVTNKQSCEANIRLSYDNKKREKLVATVDTFQIPFPVSGKIQAKTETNCGFADFGQLELSVIIGLPIDNLTIEGRWLTSTKILLKLNIGEVTGTDNYITVRIRGKSGKVYNPVVLFIPTAMSNTTQDVALEWTKGSWYITSK